MISLAEYFKLVGKSLNASSHMDFLDEISHDKAFQDLDSVIDSLFFDRTNLQKSHNDKWLALGYIPNGTSLLFEETRKESCPLLGVKLFDLEHLLNNLAALDKNILILLLANRENELLINTIKALSSWIGLTVAPGWPLLSWITDDHFVTRLSF